MTTATRYTFALQLPEEKRTQVLIRRLGSLDALDPHAHLTDDELVGVVSGPTMVRLHRRATSICLAAVSLLSIALAFGCGNDSIARTAGANGNGSGNGGTGATGGGGDVQLSGAALCSLAFGAEGSTGFIRLVPDEELPAGGPIDSRSAKTSKTAGSTRF